MPMPLDKGGVLDACVGFEAIRVDTQIIPKMVRQFSTIRFNDDVSHRVSIVHDFRSRGDCVAGVARAY